MSNPDVDAKFLLRNGIETALADARDMVKKADKLDDMQTKHAAIVLAYVQGYADAHGQSVRDRNGWDGANVSDGWCAKCLCRNSDMRIYHGPDGVHADLCETCAGKVSSAWHGCGCGG